MIHSLATKLTLAFLLVGVVGALLVALLVGIRTRSEFDRFLTSRDQDVLIQALGDYYAAHGSWSGIEQSLAADPQLSFYSRRLTLIGPDSAVIIGGRAPSSAEDLIGREPVRADGQVVGYVLLPSSERFVRSYDRDRPPPPEGAFLERVAWATAISAAAAALIALILGSLLARTLTRPVRELTAATQAMAEGRLDQQVKVRSRDEIGRLAASFNRMSSDLAQASQSRKQMTADLAHDLRTPLSVLRGYTEGLKDGRIQGTPTLYGIMHSEVEHLRHLVEDLRMLSLADAGELTLNRRLIDPGALIERSGLTHIVQAEQQGLRLEVEAAPDLPSVAVDTERMAQVLNNLVSNALRHTTQGAITLAAMLDGDQVLLQVRDTGSGIDRADLPHIFDRFYRVDKARQRGDGYTSGLGLAIAKAIVEAHGGSVTVESAPGQGAAFTIALPVAP